MASKNPAFIDMIKTAITELKERGGSSLPAIKKYLSANNEVDFTKGSDKSHLLRALKNGSEKGTLIKVKASYKVAKEAKKKKPVAKKKKKKTGSANSGITVSGGVVGAAVRRRGWGWGALRAARGVFLRVLFAPPDRKAFGRAD